MMNLRITTRTRPDAPEYQDIRRDVVRLSQRCLHGDGSPQHPFAVEMELYNPAPNPWSGVLHLEVTAETDQARFYLPAFLYGWNQGEKPLLPGAKWNPRVRPAPCDWPYSPFWMTKADRLSHPVALLWYPGRMLGISGPPWLMSGQTLRGFNGFSCTLGQTSAVGFTLGYEDAPYTYVDAQQIHPRSFHGLTLAPGEKLCFTLHLYDFPSPDPQGLLDVVENVYARWHQPPRKGAAPRACVQDLALAIHGDCWLEDAASYATMVAWQAGKAVALPHTSIAWTGGAEIATPMLMAATRLNHAAMRERALACLQRIVDESLNPASGLPYESWEQGRWSINGWWQPLLLHHGHSSYVVGQALYYLLKAYAWEKQHHQVTHGDWLRFVQQVCGAMASTRNAQGEYPYVWSAEDGHGLEYDSFAGCWCLTAQLLLMQVTGDLSPLEACKVSEAHYFDAYVRRMECYATPMDTFRAVDSEGILAYIRGVRLLHELTGEEMYLERLRVALGYEFTFKFCYNVPIQTPPLSRIGWSSCGGSVTSTANHHIHPMSSGIMDELAYYVAKTHDPYYRQRLQDVCAWNLQTYARYDGEYDFGKKGWMSERFCYSEGLLLERYPDGQPASTWFYFLPWGAANILEGMCGDCYHPAKGAQ